MEGLGFFFTGLTTVWLRALGTQPELRLVLIKTSSNWFINKGKGGMVSKGKFVGCSWWTTSDSLESEKGSNWLKVTEGREGVMSKRGLIPVWAGLRAATFMTKNCKKSLLRVGVGTRGETSLKLMSSKHWIRFEAYGDWTYEIRLVHRKCQDAQKSLFSLMLWFWPFPHHLEWTHPRGFTQSSSKSLPIIKTPCWLMLVFCWSGVQRVWLRGLNGSLGGSDIFLMTQKV